MIRIKDINQMENFAEILVRYIEPGSLILLDGNLGAGKTTLSQFIGKHLGVKRNINSPTFNIIKSYNGTQMKFHHMDCYRLEEAEEDLGFDEYFEDHALTVIEWSDFISEFLPEHYLRISIQVEDESIRNITLKAKGDRYVKLKEEAERELLAAGYIE